MAYDHVVGGVLRRQVVCVMGDIYVVVRCGVDAKDK